MGNYPVVRQRSSRLRSSAVDKVIAGWPTIGLRLRGRNRTMASYSIFPSFGLRRVPCRE